MAHAMRVQVPLSALQKHSEINDFRVFFFCLVKGARPAPALLKQNEVKSYVDPEKNGYWLESFKFFAAVSFSVFFPGQG